MNAPWYDERQGGLTAIAVQEEDDGAIPIVVVLVGMYPMMQTWRGGQRHDRQQMCQHEHRNKAVAGLECWERSVH